MKSFLQTKMQDYNLESKGGAVIKEEASTHRSISQAFSKQFYWIMDFLLDVADSVF